FWRSTVARTGETSKMIYRECLTKGVLRGQVRCPAPDGATEPVCFMLPSARDTADKSQGHEISRAKGRAQDPSEVLVCLSRQCYDRPHRGRHGHVHPRGEQ